MRLRAGSGVWHSGRAAIVLAGAVVALFAFPAIGSAWTLTKSTNGVVMVPQSTDSTGTYEISIRYGYSGGENLSFSYDPTAFGSYTYTRNVLTYSHPGSVRVSGIEVPLVDGYRIQRVTLNNTTLGKEDYCFVVLHEPLDVKMSNDVTIGAMPDVALSAGSTLSVDSTLAVDPWATADLPDGWLSFVVSLGVASVGWIAGTTVVARRG